ncbi:MAG: shikimate kinase [Melioribacteraceae bacterium]|nr:shikimate kinase [Melioribacteraceae bacterium]MCF8353575.1 shikimate kinase [Melioribacteraceae bacterium]MCF8393498.1 shikimate kinase [Melioribacteraceae bacterium]MCF8419308.1 shikimate kinase [Melioribacteraceae bacterium]
MRTKRIYLTGFMTSGKSTIGPILANVLGWDFYDLDKVIEKEQGKSIVEIFEELGEEKFRKIEHETISRIASQENLVLSLGGGTITVDEIYSKLKSTGTLIYLKVTPEMLYKRLKNKIDRPLFRDLVLAENSKEEFIERIERMLNERSKYYEGSDLIIDSDNYPVGITVDKIAKKIKRFINEKN